MNWSQLQTILWLRLRLVLNQWRRGGGVGAVLAGVVTVGAITLGVGTFVGGLLAGIFAFKPATPMMVMLLVWAGLTGAFLLFWGVGLLAELQRAEPIDLHRLMHLPVLLGQLFFLNYLASHAALSVLLTVPAMLGLALGLALSRGPAMLLLVPLALSMVFMVTAWTYCLRGWLASLMSNPRRRQAVVLGITLVMVLVFQAPNLYFNVVRRDARPPAPTHQTAAEAQTRAAARQAAEQKQLERFTGALPFLPPFWLPVGAQALAQGRVAPALFGLLGSVALGALGLRRAYRSTLLFYRGETGGQAPAAMPRASAAPAAQNAAAAQTTAAPNRDRFLERTLPGVPEQAAAVALATFRSLLRAPEVRMSLGMAFIFTLIFLATTLARSAPVLTGAAPAFVLTGLVTMTVFMMFGLLANQFGFDRAGFRALLLAPVERRHLLLGKNLALLPVAGGFGIVLCVAVTLWLGLSPTRLVAGLLQLGAALCLAFTAGNLLSIIVPWRIQPGTMKPSKMPGGVVFLMVVSQFLLPVALLPIFVPPLAEFLWEKSHGAGWVPINLLLSLPLVSAAAALYWFTLAPLARLLQRREHKIIERLTTEVE